MATNFKFKNAALMMALAAAYPIQSYAVPAGTALFSQGDVTVRRGTAATPMARGSSVESGDTIETGAAGRAQVRFTDGGLIALQPNSQFNIAKYSDANDPKQDAFLVDLLRGGMRAITGLIGKRNRDNYKVTTTTATIGIRGSAFLLSYQPDGTLVVSTEQDAIEVCTQAGCTGLTAGESARVVSKDQPAIRTSTRATIPVPDPQRAAVDVGDNAKNNGTSSTIPAAPTSSPAPAPVTDSGIRVGMAFVSAGLVPSTQQNLTEQPAVAVAVTRGQPLDQRQYLDGTLVVDVTSGKPTFFLGKNNDRVSSSGSATVIATTGTYAANNLMILGTWNDATWTSGSGGVGTGTAGATLTSTGFATGIPTASTALASLSGMRGEYSLANATPVYATNGSIGQLMDTSKLTVDFLGAGNFADVNLNVQFPAVTLPAGVTVETPPNVAFNLRGGVNGTGAGFAGSLSVSNGNCVNASSFCGLGYVTGFVGGPNAAAAGLSYTANNISTYGNFGGAATFSQTSQGSTPATAISVSGSGGSGMTVIFNDASNRVSQYSFSTNSYGGSGSGFGGTSTTNFQGEAFTGYTNSSFNGSGTFMYSSSQSIARSSSSPLSYGALGKVTDTDFIGWGVWSQGAYSMSSGYPNGSGLSNSSNALDYVHYIAGKPTSQLPNGMSASYTMVGGTAPTATTGSGTSVGQLLNGTLNVNFGSSSVGVNINTQFGSTVVNINVPQGSNQNYNTPAVNVNGGTFQSNSCGNVAINGMFTGSQAYRAGLVFKATGTAVGTVNGAAAFQRTSGFYNAN